MREALPYPQPSSKAASAVMRGNRRVDTKPEIAVRSILQRRGRGSGRTTHSVSVGALRDPTSCSLAAILPYTSTAASGIDALSTGPNHGRNTMYWEPKLRRNVERDREFDRALEASGWTVLRIWEHVDPGRAAEQITWALEGRGSPQPTEGLGGITL